MTMWLSSMKESPNVENEYTIMKQENSPLTEINRKTFFFGTARAPAFPGNLKEYSISNGLYICEKPF